MRHFGITMLACAFSACAQGSAAETDVTVERRVASMGTWLSLRVTAETRAHAVAASEAVLDQMAQVERRLSTWVEDSELARLNAAPLGPTVVSEALADDLRAALACAQMTDGAFDPTVGALVDAWHLRSTPQHPTTEALRAARKRVGHEHVQIHGQTVHKRRDIEFEEGGFGKGIALRQALATLGEHDVARAWVNLGGQVLHLGETHWIGVAHPNRRNEAAAFVALSGGSIATSANSEREILSNGENLGHLLDPRNGELAADFGSLSVRADDPVLADCLSTGLYVLGQEAALAFANRTQGVDIVIGQSAKAPGSEPAWLASEGIELRRHLP